MQQLNSIDPGSTVEVNAENANNRMLLILGYTESVNTDKTKNVGRAVSQSRQACALWKEENQDTASTKEGAKGSLPSFTAKS